MKRKEVIQHYVQTLFTPTCVPLCWAEPAFRRCARNEGKVRALWARTENQELYRARIGSHKKLRLRSHGTGRIFDWPKVSTGNSVHTEPCESFVLFRWDCSDGTDNRIIIVLLCTKRFLTRSKMASSVFAASRSSIYK